MAAFDANANLAAPAVFEKPIAFRPPTAGLKRRGVSRRRTGDSSEALQRYDRANWWKPVRTGCDSRKCLLPLAKPHP